jgi:hypothetical protein
MKKYLFLLLFFPLSSCDTARQILEGVGTNTGGLTTTEIASGLKEALSVGTNNGTSRLSSLDGFFANAAIKILMPPEAQKVESTLRSVGLGNVVDKAVLAMNRAAEDAARSAGTIFLNSIRQMTITDAVNILRGGNTAATNYFKQKTTDALMNAFRPSIQNALVKVNATKYWNDVFTVYNQFSTNKVNTDLTAYVTQRAVDGIFYEIGQEEMRIRQNPAARVTDLLKRVFGSSLAQGS